MIKKDTLVQKSSDIKPYHQFQLRIDGKLLETNYSTEKEAKAKAVELVAKLPPCKVVIEESGYEIFHCESKVNPFSCSFRGGKDYIEWRLRRSGKLYFSESKREINIQDLNLNL